MTDAERRRRDITMCYKGLLDDICRVLRTMPKNKTCGKGGLVGEIWEEAVIAVPSLGLHIAWASNVRWAQSAGRDAEDFAVARESTADSPARPAGPPQSNILPRHGNDDHNGGGGVHSGTSSGGGNDETDDDDDDSTAPQGRRAYGTRRWR